MAFSVFISYSTPDLANATALGSWMTAAGAQPFLAEYSLAPGRPLAADIVGAIQRCDLFLLLWSRNARESEWVPQEIGIARGTQKPIIPVVLQHGLELPGFIKDLKFLALYPDPSASVQWLHRYVMGKVKERQISNAVGLGVLGAVLLLLFSGKGK
jgi:hypothetical protein